MEITARRRRPRWQRAVLRTLLTLGVVLAFVLLLPPALGLRLDAVTRSSEPYAVGTLLLEERVSVAGLEVGDVIAVPDRRSGDVLARTIVRIRGDVIRTREAGERRADAMRIDRGAYDKVALAVPVLGYPALLPGPVLIGGGGLAVLLVLLIAVAGRRAAPTRPEPASRLARAVGGAGIGPSGRAVAP